VRALKWCVNEVEFAESIQRSLFNCNQFGPCLMPITAFFGPQTRKISRTVFQSIPTGTAGVLDFGLPRLFSTPTMLAAPFAKSIKAVVFDAYGTLLDVNAAASKLSSRIGTDWQDFSNLWRAKQLNYTWLRSLMKDSYVPFDQITRSALQNALKTHNLEDAGLEDELMELYMELDAYPEVPAVLSKLRSAGYKTAILSNGNPSMLDSAVTSAEIKGHLDAVLSVDPVKIYKPDSRVYQLAMDRFGLGKEEILFVSSNGWDAHGASQFGFKVFWCNRSGAVDDFGLPGKLDVEGKSLEAIAEVLGL